MFELKSIFDIESKKKGLLSRFYSKIVKYIAVIK